MRGRFAVPLVVLGLVLAGASMSPAGGGQPASTSDAGAGPRAVEFFVSPRGNDNWSGKFAEPGEKDGPRATVAQAREVVRSLRKTQGEPRPIRIVLRGGTYQLDSAHNLYWNAAGVRVRFGTKNLGEWQKHGQDKNSLIADPLFADPAGGDYTLRPGSPAARIGFESWDRSAVGPRKHLPASGAKAKSVKTES